MGAENKKQPWPPSQSFEFGGQIGNLRRFLASEFDVKFAHAEDVALVAIRLLEAFADKRAMRDDHGSALGEFAVYTNCPTPSVRGSDTSEAAAESMEPKAATLRAKALAIISCYPSTCDEIEVEMGGKHQTISPRIWELKNLGFVSDSGVRRRTRSGRNAVVYKATARGRGVVEKKCS